jgi:hypothetical protein
MREDHGRWHCGDFELEDHLVLQALSRALELMLWSRKCCQVAAVRAVQSRLEDELKNHRVTASVDCSHNHGRIPTSFTGSFDLSNERRSWFVGSVAMT